jgi:hypothetical protein
VLSCLPRNRSQAAEDAEFQARLELIKAEAAQKKAAGVSKTAGLVFWAQNYY